MDREQTTFNLETDVQERKTKQLEIINRCYKRTSTSGLYTKYYEKNRCPINPWTSQIMDKMDVRKHEKHQFKQKKRCIIGL